MKGLFCRWMSALFLINLAMFAGEVAPIDERLAECFVHRGTYTCNFEYWTLRNQLRRAGREAPEFENPGAGKSEEFAMVVASSPEPLQKNEKGVSVVYRGGYEVHSHFKSSDLFRVGGQNASSSYVTSNFLLPPPSSDRGGWKVLSDKDWEALKPMLQDVDRLPFAWGDKRQEFEAQKTKAYLNHLRSLKTQWADAVTRLESARGEYAKEIVPVSVAQTQTDSIRNLTERLTAQYERALRDLPVRVHPTQASLENRDLAAPTYIASHWKNVSLSQDKKGFWPRMASLWLAGQMRPMGVTDDEWEEIGDAYQNNFTPEGLIQSEALGPKTVILARAIGEMLQTRPLSAEGRAIRRLMNQGLVIYGTHDSGEIRSEVLGALALTIGADHAYAATDPEAAKWITQKVNGLFDSILGFVPGLSVINDSVQIIHGMATGEDYSGKAMATADYALRGFGVFLSIPVVSKAVVTVGGKIIKPVFVVGGKVIRKLDIRPLIREWIGVERHVVIDVAEEFGKEVTSGKVITGEQTKELILLSKRKFNHTFLEHGMDVNIKQLGFRAKAMNKNVGQWLDEQWAAQQILEKYKDLKDGVGKFPIPPGKGRYIKPDGSIQEATHFVIIDGDTRHLITTAYPCSEDYVPRKR